jgi:hypothetical protein
LPSPQKDGAGYLVLNHENFYNSCDDPKSENNEHGYETLSNGYMKMNRVNEEGVYEEVKVGVVDEKGKKLHYAEVEILTRSDGRYMPMDAFKKTKYADVAI